MKLFLAITFLLFFIIGLKRKYICYRGCCYDYKKNPILYFSMLVITLFASVLCFLWFLEIV